MTDPNRLSAPKPAIVAPVSRYLGVADASWSIAFYRDVLGFEVRSVRDDNGVPADVELAYGPALIQLGAQDSALDSTGARRPRGSAILFFISSRRSCPTCR